MTDQPHCRRLRDRDGRLPVRVGWRRNPRFCGARHGGGRRLFGREICDRSTWRSRRGVFNILQLRPVGRTRVTRFLRRLPLRRGFGWLRGGGDNVRGRFHSATGVRCPTNVYDRSSNNDQTHIFGVGGGVCAEREELKITKWDISPRATYTQRLTWGESSCGTLANFKK